MLKGFIRSDRRFKKERKVYMLAEFNSEIFLLMLKCSVWWRRRIYKFVFRSFGSDFLWRVWTSNYVMLCVIISFNAQSSHLLVTHRNHKRLNLNYNADPPNSPLLFIVCVRNQRMQFAVWINFVVVFRNYIQNSRKFSLIILFCMSSDKFRL